MLFAGFAKILCFAEEVRLERQHCSVASNLFLTTAQRGAVCSFSLSLYLGSQAVVLRREGISR